MSVEIDKTNGDIVFSGWEEGIATSPHKGIGNLQNVNIQTETGEVMCSFSRVQQTLTPFSGLTANWLSSAGGTDNLNIIGASFSFSVGMAITLGAGIGTLSGNYYVLTVVGSTGNQTITLTATYNGAAVSNSGSSAQTALISSFNPSQWIIGTKAIENYYDGTIQQTRYYLVTTDGYVWVQDTGTHWGTQTWTCIDVRDGRNNPSGLEVYCGYLHLFQSTEIWVKETVLLGVAWTATSLQLNATSSIQPHFALAGHQAVLNYTDANYVATIEANSVSSGNLINNFSYGSYTFATFTLTALETILEGGFPLVGQQITFTSTATLPTGVNANTVYYVTNGTNSNYNAPNGTFSISATVGGSAISLSGGSGTQYFNSYNPSVATTYIFTPQACTLPNFEIAQSLAEAGNTLIIGCRSNVLYPWDQESPTAQGIINLPENNVVRMIPVNNMVYIFAGNKGNIYITNGSTASSVISVSDYCAGINGVPASYVEPYFIWGGSDYIRGRVYFSLQDQTAAKTGNCGGVWSFVPTQNFFVGQDTGLSLRMENTNSYGTQNGMASVIVQNQVQSAVGVQYFTGWQSTYSGASYGIDTSGIVASTTAIVETELISLGTFLEKVTPTQFLYKLAAPLAVGESVALNYRKNVTDAWTSCGTIIQESSSPLSGYTPTPDQNLQSVQMQAQLIPNGSGTGSFVRLLELRVRNEPEE